ncbi:MAG: hypothetical protein GEV10_28245 [Streptosporangiales bacterium]|nr:hypothetical protein [Streptosporangiales bacterium]
MDHRSRSWIGRRLRSLALLELLNIPLQAVIWFAVVDLPVTVPNAVGFALFAFLLLQGASYWAAKLRRFGAPGGALPGVGAFRIGRVANVAVLLAGLAYAVRSVVADPGAGSIPGLVFALVAVLEYVNYFHVQLMYDNADDLRYLFTRGLRRAHLARDLRTRGRSRRARV